MHEGFSQLQYGVSLSLGKDSVHFNIELGKNHGRRNSAFTEFAVHGVVLAVESQNRDLPLLWIDNPVFGDAGLGVLDPFGFVVMLSGRTSTSITRSAPYQNSSPMRK
jgi:hypothetical protein